MFTFLRKTFLYILALPLLFILLGTASNQLVLNANYGTFPVRINDAKLLQEAQGEAYELPGGAKVIGKLLVLPSGKIMIDPTHCVMDSYTHLNFLADVFERGDSVESVGDLLIYLGMWSWGFAPCVWGVLTVTKLKKEDRY